MMSKTTFRWEQYGAGGDHGTATFFQKHTAKCGCESTRSVKRMRWLWRSTAMQKMYASLPVLGCWQKLGGLIHDQ